MVEEWLHLTDIVLSISMLGILFMYLLNLKIDLEIPKVLSMIYFFFLLFIFISSLVNGSLQSLLSSFRYILIFITLSIVVPNLLKEKTLPISMGALICSQIPLIVLSFTKQNPFIDIYGYGAYSGIFYNPNSYGLVVATIFVVILGLYYEFIGSGRYGIQLLLLLSLFSLFLLTIFSSSRTSVTAIIFIIIMFLILYVIKNNGLKKISIKRIRNIFLKCIASIFCIVIFIKSKYFNIFEGKILEKYISKYNSGDVLDQRGYIFSNTISEAKLFGYGPDYFTKEFGIAAHNTFISILGQFGLCASVLFLILWMVLINKSIKFYFKSENRYSMLPVLIVTFFLLTSITEIMLMKTSMLLGMIIIGLIFVESNYKRN
ncbi:O-antigen ligase family protein [Bacillus massiliigorillae]|uniref:O-antigen ligase family protein n=1 Tax=Bacillus massiliigorillae TaxID=1243664 RepID=UPI0005AB7FEC|nr:O-antigen ligase family protein [Bacillus massiliigorillae]